MVPVLLSGLPVRRFPLILVTLEPSSLERELDDAGVAASREGATDVAEEIAARTASSRRARKHRLQRPTAFIFGECVFRTPESLD